MTQNPTPPHWHHSPLHYFEENRAYMITSGTLYKKHFFHDETRLALLENILLTAFDACKWVVQAWAVFSNHYHIVACSPSPGEGKPLNKLIQRCHSQSAQELNKLDNTPGRRVWFQYWDSLLTFEHSYYARLNYTHCNAVKHGLVQEANQYPFCSARWFESKAEPALHAKITGYKWDTVKVNDDYTVK
ncbi:MAG: hypothetical protein GX130_14215 [Candidatus Hydrogenedens sp.]|nr:hypothetical protein [Candidatus Hydrogenedens sp.]